MVVCPSRNNMITFFDESGCHCFGIFLNLHSITEKLIGKSFSESNSLCSDNVHKRTSLISRKYGSIKK